MSIIREFTLYLHAGITTPKVIHANQYSQGETWIFKLLQDDGSVYVPSTGALIGVKADGHAIAGLTGTVLGDGRVSITTTQQLTAAAGDATCELTIDGGTNGSANFVIRVEKKPTDDAILSESDLSIIQEGMNSVTPVVIAEAVSDWLEDNLTDPPIDPSLSISNAAADAKVTGDKITELKTEIEKIAVVTDSPNLIDPSQIQTGKFYKSIDNVATLADTNPAFDCYLLPVEQGKTYTITGVSYYCFGVMENMTIFNTPVNDSNGQAQPTITINSSAVKYLALSWKRATYPTETYQAVEGSTLPPFMPYGTYEVSVTEKTMEDIRNKIDSSGETEYFVGYGQNDGVKYFSSCMACLWAVSQATGKKIVHIKGGSYNLYTELGGRTFIESKNVNDDTPYDSDVQPWLTDTKIIGDGRVILNFKLPNDIPHDNYWLFSALNVMGNFEMENVQIYAENCRYAVHDESKSNYPDTIRKYKNCIISHRRTDSATNSQTIGCGFSERTRCEYENLILINNNGIVWSCHANAGTSLEFNDVVFRNEAITESLQKDVIRISNNGMYNVPVTAKLANCFIGNGKMILREENNDNRDSNTRVDLINTHLGALDFRYTTNIYQPVTYYNTITGEVTELVSPNA